MQALAGCVGHNLSLVHGLPGSGRSSALMCALHDHLPAPMYIALEAHSRDDVLAALARAVRSLAPDAESLSPLQDPTAMLHEVLEVSERHALTVVVDAPWQTVSLHLLIELVTRHARASTWVVILDQLPIHAPLLHIVEVPWPTHAEKLDWLTRMLPGEGAESLEAWLATRPAASFAQLEQRLARERSPLNQLSEQDLCLALEVDALSPFSQEHITRRAPLLASVRRLESMGALQQRAGQGWRLTPAARQRTCALSHPALQLGDTLDEQDVCEGFALFELDAWRGAWARAQRLLEAHFHAWIARDLVHLLWALLQHSAAPAASAQYALRCALLTQDSQKLEALSVPAEADATAQLLWVQVLMSRGDFGGAFAVFERYRGELPWALQQLLAIVLTINDGRFAESLGIARSWLESERDFDVAQRLFLDSLIALAMVWEGRSEAAHEQVSALALTLEQRVRQGCAQAMDRYAWVNVARVLHLARDLGGAASACARARSLPLDPHDMFSSAYSHVSLDYFEALLAIESLELARTEQLLLPLSIRFQSAHELGFHVHQLLAAVSWLADDYDEGLRRIASIPLAHQRLHEAWNVLPIYRAQMLAGRDGFALTDPVSEDTPHAARARAFNLLHTLRVEGSAAFERIWSAYSSEQQDAITRANAWLGIWRALLDDLEMPAYATLQSLLAPIQEQAFSQQHPLRQVTCLRLRAIFALCTQHASAPDSWREVLAAAQPYNAPLARQAEIILRVCEGTAPPSPRELIQLASELPDEVTRRLVLGLLGCTHPLDRLELLMVRRLSHFLGWQTASQGHHPAQSIWVDFEEAHAHSMSASVRLPSRGAQLLLLKRLATQPGVSCSKEELFRDVWGIQTYHPLKHENRLRLAIFKLRKLLRTLLPGACDEAFILTHEGGYALSGGVCVVVGCGV